MDTSQTRRSFYYSFTISSQNTVQIHPRHGGHSTTHSDFSNPIQTRYAPDTTSILYLIHIHLSTTSSYTLQTRMPFWPLHQQFDSPRCIRHRNHSVTYSDPSYSLRYTADTEVILLLIQISTSDTF